MNDLASPTSLALIAGSLAYFILHSLLASLGVKTWLAQRWPQLMPAYRLGFNSLAVLLLLPLLVLVYLDPGPALWSWQGPWRWLSYSLTALAVLGFLWSLTAYDLSVFLGLRQWREGLRQTSDPEQLYISTLHRFVRHPWYFLLLLLLWSRDQSLNQALFYGLASGYLVIGSRLEEQKLLAQHGELYRRYQRQVPGLIPLPWRWLSKAEAKALVNSAAPPQPGSAAASER